MSFDWTTLLLEVVNFLVLVWILKRVFYRPVQDMIARRRASIEKTLADARAAEARAQEIKVGYENRMTDWEKERAAARARLAEEIGSERQRQLARLAQTIEAERAKNRAAEEQRLAEQARAAEEQAIAQASAFLARLLQRLADGDLDARVADLVARDLAQLPDARKRALIDAARAPGARLEITAAHDLPESAQRHLVDAMQTALGIVPPVSTRVDPALVGGVRVALGPWILEATFADELAFFRTGVRRGA